MNRKRNQPLKSKIEIPWDTTGVATESNADSTQNVSLKDIYLPQRQPRRYFDPTALKELASSIQQHGILQPLLVRPRAGSGYELVAGERRYRAAKDTGLKEVPVVVRDLDNDAAFQLALIENLQREDLNPVEETEGILQLLAIKLGRKREDIPPLLRRFQHERKEAEKTSNNVIGKDELENNKSSNNVIGKKKNLKEDESNTVNPDLEIVEGVFIGLGKMTWESFANNRLPLLNLPEDILEAMRSGKIAYTKAKAIAQITDESERRDFLEQAIKENWSLSEIKERISEKKTPGSTPDTESNNYKERFASATSKLKRSRIWSNPKKRKQIEKLVLQLEALTQEV
ncbi:MAG: ParB/RepB/Spo0J family partition protein [Cyanobacteria bacterium P01_G01_bin.49]